MMAAAAGPNNNSFAQNTAFADAVQRAKQVTRALLVPTFKFLLQKYL